MTNASRPFAVAFLILLVGSFAPGCTTVRSPGRFQPDDEAAIRERVAMLESAWNKHDMKAIGPVYHDDAEFINVVGMHWRGREAIVKAHLAYDDLMFKHTNIRTDELSVRPLSTDHAIAVWLCTMDPFTTPSGTKVPRHQNLMTMVFTKDEHAGWQVLQSQNTTVDAEAAQFDPVNRN